mmetsp:Transcript_88783/g.167345  ORF Transcript_88783/g.167345 Transcript_88783/m.167345 type:complete len:126 (+) Transcript_88783:141-518(+)
MTAASVLVQKTQQLFDIIPASQCFAVIITLLMQMCLQAHSKAAQWLLQSSAASPQMKNLDDKLVEELERELEAEAEIRLEAEQEMDLSNEVHACMEADIDHELYQSMQSDLLDLLHDADLEFHSQ